MAGRAVRGALRRRPPRRVWRWTWFRGRGDAGRQLWWGLGSAALVATLIAAAAWLSLSPPGTATYHLDMTETGQLRTGDDVRVAGVPVGSVSAVRLRQHDVRVTVRVDSDAFIGAQSTAAVKMLTAVGGFYLDINSMGTDSLGAGSIPAQRVQLPYSLTETFQAAGPKLGAIDAAPLRRSLAEIQQAAGGNPGQLRHALTTLSGLVGNLERQRDQMGRFTSVIAEYSQRLNANGDRLTQVMRDASLFLSTASLNVKGYRAFMKALELTLRRITPLAVLYQRDIDRFEKQVRVISGQMDQLLDKFAPMIDNAMELVARAKASVREDGSLSPNGSAGLLASSYCIPIETVVC